MHVAARPQPSAPLSPAPQRHPPPARNPCCAPWVCRVKVCVVPAHQWQHNQARLHLNRTNINTSLIGHLHGTQHTARGSAWHGSAEQYTAQHGSAELYVPPQCEWWERSGKLKLIRSSHCCQHDVIAPSAPSKPYRLPSLTHDWTTNSRIARTHFRRPP